uniref:Secreted protein n=1 Tax=Hordeum vulgare subsp. vulgare TaxID=112509 RepID=A0A8I6XK03_HORVV
MNQFIYDMWHFLVRFLTNLLECYSLPRQICVMYKHDQPNSSPLFITDNMQNNKKCGEDNTICGQYVGKFIIESIELVNLILGVLQPLLQVD